MCLSVTQKHGAGCAVACVAYVLSVSYDMALKLFSRPKQAIDRGFLCREIVSALSKGGRHYTYCKAIAANKKFVRVPGLIVFIARSKKYPIGHFLTRTVEDSWMNPRINFPCIASAESGFQKRLPGKAEWIIYPIQ
jgi:hypothetical protein